MGDNLLLVAVAVYLTRYHCVLDDLDNELSGFSTTTTTNDGSIVGLRYVRDTLR